MVGSMTNATVTYEAPNGGIWTLLFEIGTGEDFGPHTIEHRYNGFLKIPPEKVASELAALAWNKCYAKADGRWGDDDE